MRVFITGASGWVGSALVPELLAAGHEVVGLARSDTAAGTLTARGVHVHRGSLNDLETLRTGAARSDGVIHLAYRHDLAFSGDPAAAAHSDLQAIEALGAALRGSDRPFIIASGLAGLQAGRIAAENHIASPDRPGGQRAIAAAAVIRLAEQGIRSAVVRLPPTVHGAGDSGFMSRIVEIARTTGISGYVGEGTNRWPAVHRADAAHLFRLALESAPAGSVLHGVAETGVAIRDVAAVIGSRLKVPVRSIPAEDALEHFGWLGGLLSGDYPASSLMTRTLLDWQPTRPGLLNDLEREYFAAPSQCPPVPSTLSTTR